MSKFTIRRLEVGERANPATDFYYYSGDIGFVETDYVIKHDHMPRFRISIIAEQPAATSVDVGEGWRLLEPNEPIQEGDQTASKDRNPLFWIETGRWIDEHPQLSDMYYRRRIPAPASYPDQTPNIQDTACAKKFPSVDLAAHERREYQCAIEDMRKECQELQKQVDELVVKKSFVVGCLHITEAERDKLRDAIRKFGNVADFDWNILGKIDELEQERDKLREELAECQEERDRFHRHWKTTCELLAASKDAEPVKWESDWSFIPKATNSIGWVKHNNSVHEAIFSPNREYITVTQYGFSRTETTDWLRNNCYQFALVTQQPPLPVKAPAPQEDWKELTKGDTYSGPGQVRMKDGDVWRDAWIVGVEEPGSVCPFCARITDGSYVGYSCYYQARVRAAKGVAK
jgi:hypothetical protein